ncbi:hypothetical protein [Nocardioides sp. AE5]|uniref:hypothetical protein n=1 Tax=Nocardioides sp. AE5 TaxID=2962573 RepID=UPI0028817745|nr:hypothetical protein [Nocardioides sp. AE5]MDT0203470.1 hypothetical protein [Nocardioides sp. AE5]
MKHRRLVAMALTPLIALALAACGDEPAHQASDSPSDPGSSSVRDADPSTAAPVTTPSDDAVVLLCQDYGQVIAEITDGTAAVTAPEAPMPIQEVTFTQPDPDYDRLFTSEDLYLELIAMEDGTWRFGHQGESSTCTQTAGASRADTRVRATPPRYVEFDVPGCDLFAALSLASLGVEQPLGDWTDLGLNTVECRWQSPGYDRPDGSLSTESVSLTVGEAPVHYEEDLAEHPQSAAADLAPWSWGGGGGSETFGSSFYFIAESKDGTAFTCMTTHDGPGATSAETFATPAREFCDAALALATGN